MANVNAIGDQLPPALVEVLLSLADDKFFHGCRNSDWTGLGPILEEDIAFSALAQDDIAHAKAIYEFIAERTGDNADRLAYGRRPAEYRCAAIVTLPDEFDWALAVVRQFFCDHFDELRIQRLARSSEKPLSQLAERMLAEERLALGHADGWIVRLARGTEESCERVCKAISSLTPHACQLFEPTDGAAELERTGLYPPLKHEMFEMWSIRVESVLDKAGLEADLRPPPQGFQGGRHGRHPGHFQEWLDEICEVYRGEPGAAW